MAIPWTTPVLATRLRRMGNVCCGAGDYEARQRQELLKEGSDFKKKTPYLGGVLTKTESIYLQLNAAATRLQWRVTPTTSNAKMEELSIGRVGKVCPSGGTDLIILGAGGQKLLELTAPTTAVRDLWVQTLEELTLQQTAAANDEEAKALQQQLAKQTEKQKERYWKDRTTELEQRRVDAEERKKKFGTVGMKYTAQAMATR